MSKVASDSVLVRPVHSEAGVGSSGRKREAGNVRRLRLTEVGKAG